jgi:predicted ATPase
MEIIKTIEIRKFRSIKSLTSELHPTDLNIFVGRNDQGKSNILRALNLFFNNETEIGQPFRFEDDYCYHANTGTGTRIEVRIDLIIEPPRNRFKDAKLLRWTKKWKRDGIIVEDRIFVKNGQKVAPQSNIYRWLDKLKYRYVPAIKGAEYFSTLMGELHDVLNESHSEELKKQGERFISGFQKITNQITVDLDDQLGIPNTIQVPSDFRILFSNLDFGTKSEKQTYHLKQRGDGIKVRHIPIILKYMTDTERSYSIPGFVKSDTIWGFEEPENNLELKYAYELAQFFKLYSKDIQIFLTTHSPAFYSLDKKENDGVNTYIVNLDAENCSQLIKKDSNNSRDLDEQMGLLNIITPYLTEIITHQKQIDELKKVIYDISEKVKCIVLTEDEDFTCLKTILEANEFNLGETEIVSYYGCDQIGAAIVIGKYFKLKRANSTIIIHRDKDYLSDEEIETVRQKIKQNGFTFMTTNGVDLESNFINPHHIAELHPKISIERAKELINNSTDLATRDSIDRLIDYTFKNNKPEKNAFAKKFRELEEEYDRNIERYRYGKKVLGHLTALVQKEVNINPKLVRPSKSLINRILKQAADEIWRS